MSQKMKMTNPEMPFLHKNIAAAGSLGLKMIQPGSMNAAKGVVICGTGPTLLDDDTLPHIRELASQGYHICALKEAVQVLTDLGITVHYTVAMDPAKKQIAKTPLVKGVKYLIASSCSPDLFKHLLDGGMEVEIFHSACGAKNEIQLYHQHFGDTTVAEGGYTVANRAYAAMTILGFKRRIMAGCPFGWREGQQYYAEGVKGQPGNSGPPFEDKGKIDGRAWYTKLDLMTSAQDLALRVKKGELEIIGDSLVASLAKHDEAYIRSVAEKSVQRGPVNEATQRKVEFKIDKDSGDLEMQVLRLGGPKIQIDQDNGDVTVTSPQWEVEPPPARKVKQNEQARAA